MKNKISLDCDGVIADVGGFFKKSFYNYFNSKAPSKLIKSIYEGNLENYSKNYNFNYNKIQKFLNEYEEKLFLSLPDLDLVEGAKESINKLKETGIEIIVNSYRPSEYKGIKQNTFNITKNWFDKNGINAQLNLAETKNEKCNNILNQNFISHVDDDPKILEKLQSKNKLFPVLFNNLYAPTKDELRYFNSWEKLSKFLMEMGEKNV